MEKIYRTDYHVHTTFSDGKAAAPDYIEAAVAAGLSEIGFSEHLNLLWKDQPWCMPSEKTGEYVSFLKKLRKTEKRIAIKIGLEVDYFPGKEELINDFISPLDLDYVIGSVHYMGDVTVDSSPDYYRERDVDEIYRSYFTLLGSAIGSGLFDILGHCDLVRIYDFHPSFDPFPLYLELARQLALHDVAFEVNTNGRNRVLGDFYPDRRFLDLFRKAGAVVCVNSDSHFPERVGQFFDEAYDLLREAGYRKMATFDKRERYLVPSL